ncbi:MAG: hypothetical protein A2189_01455 [Paenibacillus sp. RIFOXYA1_FULL_44_5]|nr:MAG: hypothetical protein A2189_01455 [Paenibacillus sp. RIFOXYA1_FULL_44_5]
MDLNVQFSTSKKIDTDSVAKISQPTAASQSGSDPQKNEKQMEELSTFQLLHTNQSLLSVSELAVAKAVEQANKAINGVPKKFEYSVNKPTGQIVVKILDADTNELIREIPPEKILNLVSNLAKLNGAIIDEKR